MTLQSLIRPNRIAATRREHLTTLPGDERIPNAAGSLTYGITVRCKRSQLWPWLIQMGADRAGWYSYDAVDNGGRPSADRIVPELQSPQVGAVFPALPGMRDGFVLVESEPPDWMVLDWPGPDGQSVVTWAFLLHAIDEHNTRLVVRVRASDRYRFRGLPKPIGLWVVRAIHAIMERKQLVEIAKRAEATANRSA